MNLIDKTGWDKAVSANPDPYGRCVIRYAQRWAEMMEEHISDGKSISDIAKKTSHDSDTEGITGFMYGCAVNILSQVWKYGEDLRKWHNGQYGHSGDGVVNPAILTISGSSANTTPWIPYPYQVI